MNSERTQTYSVFYDKLVKLDAAQRVILLIVEAITCMLLFNEVVVNH